MSRTAVAIVTAGILLASLSEGPAASQDVKGRILEASTIFREPPSQSVTSQQVRASLLALLGIASEVCPPSQYQAEIRRHVGVAGDLIEKDSMFNDKARQYLRLAYRMMTDGKTFEPPPELDVYVTPSEAQEKARKHAAKLVDAAVGAHTAGHPAETARLLLELALLIVTPSRG